MTQLNSAQKPVIGHYVLDTLTRGMYNNPLMVLREYIQNSADSIDTLDSRLRQDARIEIVVNGITRSLTITDTGSGIPADRAWSVLHDLGRSTKKLSINRGFRGIGRLGGLGYCNELVFSTKYRGETTVSQSKWDCKKLAQLIATQNNARELASVITEVAEFTRLPYSGKVSEHFFKVELHGVKCSRDVLLDVPQIKLYLSQTVPVPFSTKFSLAELIDTQLLKNIPMYAFYNIFVNGEQICKPYTDSVNIGSKTTDNVSEVEFITLGDSANPIAFGWIGKLKLLGAISSTSNIDGIRIRSGNIMVGDKLLLADLFRERRFNSYLLGELHITAPNLSLNSRRDDFEDSPLKDQFYESFIKEIGIPFSTKIREASNLRSRDNANARQKAILTAANKIVHNGYISLSQKDTIVASLENAIKLNPPSNGGLDDAQQLLMQIKNAKHFLDLIPPKEGRLKNKILLKQIFDIVYSKSSNKTDAEKIIMEIVDCSAVN